MTVVGYRLANWDTPLWAGPNRRTSRYGRDGGIVQYWSLHPLGPWAEYLRFHDIRNPAEAGELLLRPWAAELPLPDGAVELAFANAGDHGLAPVALVDDDWSACQAWSATFSGPAVIVPSAALPGTKNLVLFGPYVRSRYGLAPVDPTVDIPCDPVADLATVPSDLLRFVRWRGSAHAGYEGWTSGLPDLPPPNITFATSE